MGPVATDRWQSLFVLVMALVVAVSPLFTRTVAAAPQALAMRSLTITNVTDTSFTVNWVTDSPTQGGYLTYGSSPTDLTIRVGEPMPPTDATGDVHSITVQSLRPSTTYYFSIPIQGATSTNGGNPYQVTTGPTLSNLPPPRTVTGKILQAGGAAAAGILVTARVFDNTGLNGASGPTTSAPLSTLTIADGTWKMTLRPRWPDNSNVFQYNPTSGDFLQVTVDGGALGAAVPPPIPISIDSDGTMTTSSWTLVPGLALPTDTPTPVTSTATPTLSHTGTAQPSPAASSTPIQSPGASPRAEEASPTITPTRPSVVIPTVAPVATDVEPPPPVTRSAPSTSTPTPARGRPPAPVVPTPVIVPTPILVGLATPTPIPPAAAARPRQPGRLTPSRGTSLATPTRVVSTPTIAGGRAASASGDASSPSPLQSVTLVLASGLGLVGLGLAMSVAGFVDQQRRDG
jgi:hypothetical protein